MFFGESQLSGCVVLGVMNQTPAERDACAGVGNDWGKERIFNNEDTEARSLKNIFSVSLCLRGEGLIVIILARAGFAAGAAARVVTVTGSSRFAAQGFELIPGLDIVFGEGFSKTFAFGVFDEIGRASCRERVYSSV